MNTQNDDYIKWAKALEADALSVREERLSKLTTPEAVNSWQTEFRKSFIDIIGGALPKAPLNEKRCGVIKRDGYSIEKWTFQTIEGTRTAALYYVPDEINAQGLASVCPIGHWPEGKAVNDYQDLGGYFALHKIPSVAYDHYGIGERREMWNHVRGHNMAKSPTVEHNHFGDLLSLTGQLPLRYFLIEAMQAYRFIQSRDGVNPNMVGCTGASGGGTMTSFMAAYNPELAFAIRVCSVEGAVVINNSDAEQAPYGAACEGIHPGEYLAAIAPRPTMGINEVDFHGGETTMNLIRSIHNTLGAEENTTDYFPIEDVHGYTHPMIEAAYNFLAKNFKLPEAKQESWCRVRRVKESETYCSKTGLIHTSEKQCTMIKRIQKDVSPNDNLTKEKLAELLGIENETSAPIPYAQPNESSKNIEVGACYKMNENTLGLIAWEDEHPADWFHFDAIKSTNPNAHRARNLMAYKRTLMGVRVLQILDYLKKYGNEIDCITGDLEWSLPLLCATALLDKAPKCEIKVDALPISYTSWIEQEDYHFRLSDMIPGILEYGDINDIATLAGDKIKIGTHVDAFQRVV